MRHFKTFQPPDISARAESLAEFIENFRIRGKHRPYFLLKAHDLSLIDCNSIIWRTSQLVKKFFQLNCKYEIRRVWYEFGKSENKCKSICL